MRQKRYNEKFKKPAIDVSELQEFMQSNNLTVTDVALYIGCARGTITNYIEGKSKIPHIVKLAIEYYKIKHRGKGQ